MLSYAVLPRVIQREGGCFWHSVCIHPVRVFPLEKSDIRVGSDHPALMAARLLIHCAVITGGCRVSEEYLTVCWFLSLLQGCA